MNNKLRQTIMALSVVPGLLLPVSSAIASTSNDVIKITDQKDSDFKGFTNEELDAMGEEQEGKYQKARAQINQIKEDLGEIGGTACSMLDEIDIILNGEKDKEGKRFEIGDVPDQCKKDSLPMN